MNDSQWDEMLRVAVDVRYLIVQGGGMATKSRVEDYLMSRFNVDRSVAHGVMNTIEFQHIHPYEISGGEVRWQERAAGRPAPRIEDYPDLYTGR